MTSKTKQAKDSFGRDIRLLKDFRSFLWATWKQLGLPDPTQRQYEIAYYLQHAKNPRKVIEAFRGIGKSWITSTYVLWRLYCDPEIKILVVSASKGRADDFSTFVQMLIETWDVLRFLKPKEGQRYSKISFDVGPCKPAHAPSVKSVGVFGQLQGPRANLIVADDIEALNNADTVTKRAKLANVIKEFDSIVVPGGEIVYLGTPQTESSIYNLLPDRGYHTCIWPARFPDKDYLAYHGSRIASSIAEAVQNDPTLVGQPTDPDRFDEDDLASRELSYGRTGFSLQFMLDTRQSDALRFPLRLSDLVVMNLSAEEGPEKAIWGACSDNEWQDLPNFGKDADRFYGPVTLEKVAWTPYDQSILVIDPSGRGKDETAWAVLKQLNGQVFLVEIGADQRGYEEAVLIRIAQCAKKHKVHRVLYESNFGDGMAGQIMKPVFHRIYPVTLEEVKHHQQKERRIIDTLEPLMNRHKLIVAKDVIESDYHLLKDYPPETAKLFSLFYQMSRVTAERGSLAHDDRLDAIAMGVAFFNRQMDQDVEDAIQRKRDAALDEELRKMEEHLTGAQGHDPGAFGYSNDETFFDSSISAF